MSDALADRARFLDDAPRAALIEAWRAHLLEREPPPLPALPAPWPELHRRILALLAPWRAEVRGRPEAAERVLELLVSRVHKAAWAAASAPEHPARRPLHRALAEAEELDSRAFARQAPALLAQLNAEAIGGHGRFGALGPVAERLVQELDSIEITENLTQDCEALRAALLERWARSRDEEIAAFEAEHLGQALRALKPELERRRSAMARITRLLGVGLESVARGADWSSGFWRPETFRALEHIAERLEANPSLQQLAEALGRYEQAEQALQEQELRERRPQLKPQRGGASEIVGLHRGGELDRLTAADIGLLGDPDTELLFYARLLERQLLTYEMRGEAWFEEERPTRRLMPERSRRRGPIVICVDSSGSMQGEPERIAKTLTLAVLRVALRERRPCHLIQFSSANDLRELELSRFPAALEPLADFLAGAFHGGTDPRPALDRAMQRVESGPFARADLLLVSDGVFELDAAFLQRFDRAREAVGLQVHGLLIGAHSRAQGFDFADATWAWSGGDSLEGAAALTRSLRGSGPQSERKS
ncbi:MAG: VWA domain-containing protein [Alphaproteobacteria bacterium]|nr:VWA domain-containing protein [Alphaproteobacteria bacterium]MCB9792753.1 VWA domain-containing protein [Alphaproteobacteria bacterium]